MKKTSYYITVIVVLGVLITSFWIYQKYFQSSQDELLLFEVKRGDVQEVVKVRGEVVADKEFELGFPFSGIISNIYVSEGQSVRQGEALVKLNTTDFWFEKQQLNAVLVQNQASLNKLITGSTIEDLAIYQTKVANAEVAVLDAKSDLINKINDTYTKSDDAVHNKADKFFDNPTSLDPEIKFIVSHALDSKIENGRLLVEITLSKWENSLINLTLDKYLNLYIAEANENLDEVRSFLDDSSMALNSALTSFEVTQANLNTWKDDIFTARNNISTSRISLTSSVDNLGKAESSLKLAESELNLEQSGARSEDIEIAKAKVDETNNKIKSIEEKIRKSTIYSPASAQVTKLWLEIGELYPSNQTAVSVASVNKKIYTDVSELDIGKISLLNDEEVIISFDAFPKTEFVGRTIFIEPKEIVRDNDKYYRLHVMLENQDNRILTGMNADLVIKTTLKKDVLKIPEFAVYRNNGQQMVRILDDGDQIEFEVKTGISDREDIEILEGLEEGQIIVVLAND
jgi:multidrug efflux pump subunit AcrA (membrane-fusion protein)